MTIIEAYIKFNGQLVILLSGMSGSGVSKISREIAQTLKLDTIAVKDYIDKSYSETITIPDNLKSQNDNSQHEIINWDSDDIYDFKNLNNAINEKKNKGVIIYGQLFSRENIDADIDIQIIIKLSKPNLYEKRQKFIQSHNIKPAFSNPEINKYIFNKYTYTYFVDVTKDITYAKFINANQIIEKINEKYKLNISDENDFDNIYNELVTDEIFDYIIKYISNWLNDYNSNKNPNDTKYDETTSDTDSPNNIPINNKNDEYDDDDDDDYEGDSDDKKYDEENDDDDDDDDDDY